ncbi:MAG: CotH kinase family protein [Acidobacteria bacterium]|nr:CotH kinase family protein [Acidobacteriota bacterium]
MDIRSSFSLLVLACSLPALAAADQADAFFDDSQVREIRLVFSDANWYQTLFASHSDDPDDPYFPVKFQYGDVVLDQIGVRFKGNSSFRRNGIKKPFKLDFNEYDDDLTFLGLKKLNLHNGDLQPDFLREKLVHEIEGKHVASQRSVFVRLYVNDAYYGLYLAVEQPDKTMMQSRFGDDEDGNLYEAEEQGGGSTPNLSYLGSAQSAYENVYLLKTNESQNDFSGLIEFLDILNNTSTDELPAKLDPICDVENWLYGLAVNNLVTNLDSYLGVGAEYYLYDRDSDGRFVHIQWDHNESFGITGDGTPSIANPFALDPFYLPTSSGGGRPGGGGGNTARPFLEKTWATPEYRRLYLRMFSRILREGFDLETMSARIDTLANLIRDDVYADPNKPYTNQQFETALQTRLSGNSNIYGLKQFVQERYNYLRPYLDALAEPSDIRLNELVTSNSGAALDEAGDADPWIELYNPGPGTLTLSGFTLSDDPSNPSKWSVPARTLADGEFLVLWLDAETAEGEMHASFRLSAAGGAVHLYASGAQIDSVAYPALAAGRSLIRLGDSGEKWAITSNVSAGAANPSSGEAVSDAPVGASTLLLNELMADNDGVLEDPDEPGAYDDWFEVYNAGSTDVDMGGMFLTDNLSNPQKWTVPAGVVIPAGGRLVFIADGETAQGPLHAGFSLSASGEELGLFDSDGETLLDSIVFGVQQTDVSFGRTSDGAAVWSIFQPATPGAANALPYANFVVNAAGFTLGPVAPGSGVSLFAEGVAASTLVADTVPLPATLGGVSLRVVDSAGAEHAAPLYFVSATQVNFFLPEGVASGRAALTLVKQDGSALSGDLLVGPVSPGLFTANATGQGVGLFAAVRADSNGAQTTLAVFEYDASMQAFVPVPISLGGTGDQVYLVAYGTGFRGRSSLTNVVVEIDGDEVPVAFAGDQTEYVGLDQLNVGPLPSGLAGAGEVEVSITVDGVRGNTVVIAIE